MSAWFIDTNHADNSIRLASYRQIPSDRLRRFKANDQPRRFRAVLSHESIGELLRGRKIHGIGVDFSRSARAVSSAKKRHPSGSSKQQFLFRGNGLGQVEIRQIIGADRGGRPDLDDRVDLVLIVSSDRHAS